MSSCFHLFVVGWMDVCIYVCYCYWFIGLVWRFFWLDVYVSYMPGLPLPEGDHCRLLVPGFDMANHDPRSHNASPPPDVSPLNVDVSVVDRLAGTGRTHTILEAYNEIWS